MLQIKNSIPNTYSQHLNVEAGQEREFAEIGEQTVLHELKTAISDV